MNAPVPRPHSAFTLIEVLVVVAIIALLVAVLLPSLARARTQARLIACESNIRQLAQASAMYASQYNGRFPADSRATTYGIDWIGRNDPFGKGIPNGGSIWKYMNRARDAYTCPDDKRKNTGWYWSYSYNIMMSGSGGEHATGAHFPVYPPASGLTMDRQDHKTNMKALEGVPLFAEESLHRPEHQRRRLDR